jgi:hypothetical protein
MDNLIYNRVATPGAISCYTPSDTGPFTPHAALSPPPSSNPHATTTLQPPYSYQSPHDGLSHFGDPAPTLPSSSSVAQMTGGYHRRPLSLMPIAVPPTPAFSALIEFDESTFPSQSPTPLSIPSTP